MGELLQHQNSMVAFERNQGRCAWNWLQIFDFQQDSSAKRIKDSKLYVPLSAKGLENWGSEKNLLNVNNGKSKKISGNTILRGLSNMLFKKQFQKRKALPVKQRLKRTTSIHHLECDDYVLPEETMNFSHTANSEEDIPLIRRGERCEICRALNVINHIEKIQNVELKLHSTDNEAIRIQKLHKIWETFLKRKGSAARDFDGDVALQSKDFVTMLKFFDVHKDLFLKILKDPKFSLEKISSPSNSGKSFIKSGSFPHRIPAKRNTESSMHNHGWIANFHSVNKEVSHNDDKTTITSQATNKDLQNVRTSVDSSITATLNNNCDGDHEENEVALDHIKDFLEHMINETTKEQNRISKDAVMHKIPYGQKITEDAVTPKLFRSNSDRSYNDSLRYKSSAPSVKFQDRIVRRSRSLNESLDRYSNLLASISTKESKRMSDVPSSFKEYNMSENVANLELSGSSVSCLDEIPRSSNKEFQHEVYRHSVDTLGDLENDGPVISATDRFILDKHSQQSFLSTNGGLNEQRHTIASTEEYAGHFSPRQKMSAGLENSTSHKEIQVSEPYKISDSRKVGSKQKTVDELKDEFMIDTSYEAIKPSQVSSLDLYLDGDFEVSANYIASEEEISLRSSHVDDLSLTKNRREKLDFDSSARPETSEPTITNETVSSNHFDALNTRVEYENEFNYVSNVLKQFNFDDTDSSSLYQLESLQDIEFNIPFDQSSASSEYDDTYIYQKLLADLINESLSEIFEKFSASIQFSIYSSQLPLDDLLRTQVWAKISSHLISQTQTQTIDNIMALDFAKNDKWSSLQLPCKSLGTELSDLMLDHMLEELILEFDDD